MPKFIHAADLHIDSPLVGLDAYEGAPVERIRGATREALKNLVQLALDERAAFLVIAGDVYDQRPLLETSLFFRGQMQRLADASIPVVIVRGNHDHAGIAPRNVVLPDNVHVLDDAKAESVLLPEAGAVVHGRSYPRPDCVADLVDGYPAPVPGLLNVGLLHTGLGSVDPEHPNYAPTSSARLSAFGYQYWALGHVHNRSSHGAGAVPVEFPGNLQGRHIRETGPKGALVVEYEGTKVGPPAFRPLDVMRWHDVPIAVRGVAGAKELRALVTQHILESTGADREAGRLCAVRVRVAGTLAEGGGAPPTGLDLREYLQGSLQQAAGLLWLEKGRVDLRQTAADGSVVEQQLSGLAEVLAHDFEARRSLIEELGPVPALIRKHFPRLLEEADFLPNDASRQEDAEAVLARALELLRAELR